MDISGIGGLAYQLLLDFQKRKSDASVEMDNVDRFVRAIVLELRVSINLLDLAHKADGADDGNARDRLLLQIQMPLISAVGMGLNGVPLSKDGAQAILDGLARPQPSEGEDDGGVDQDSPRPDITDQISLMVSRLLTVQALAKTGPIGIEINWNVRLNNLRRDVIGVLKSVLASVERGRI